MKKLIKNLSLLTKKFKTSLVLIIFLQIAVTLAELISIGALFPLINVMSSEEKLLDYLVILEKNSLIINETFKNFILKNIIIISCLFITLIFLIKNIFCVAVSWYQSSFVLRLKYHLSDILFSNYLEMPHNFYLKNNTAYLIRNTGFVNYSAQVIESLLKMSSELIIAIALSIFLIFISPGASFKILILFLLIFIIIYSLTKNRLKSLGNTIKETEVHRIKTLKDSFELNREIKITNSQKYFLKNYLDSLNRQNKAIFFSRIFSIANRYVIETILVIAAMLYAYSIFLNDTDFISSLPFLVVLAAVGLRLFPSLNRILGLAQFIRTYYSMVDQLSDELIKTSKDKYNFSSKIKKIDIKKNIKLKNICQKFKDKKFEINNLNIDFFENKPSFIFGPSGSGKTTLLNILLGFVKPQSGNVLLDDKTISENNVGSIFLSVGYVPQEILIFEDTILRNILIGRDEKTIDSQFLKKILKLSLLDEFLKSLPDGINTIVGERGLNISGGQRQRIGLARALINDPKIIILDEATNSLDKSSEEKIIQNIINFSRNKILIMVSHNTNSLHNEFRIIKVNNGEISFIK